MAILNSLLGPVKGTVGNLTMSRAGGSNAYVRSKIQTMTNPRTVAQAAQRMKLKPAQRWYAAWEELLDHSWQGVPYREPSRRFFMSQVMKADASFIPYVPKFSDAALFPGRFPMSKGVLPDFSADKEGEANYLFPTRLICRYIGGEWDEAITIGQFSSAVLEANPALAAGMQLTFCAVVRLAGGVVVPRFIRIVLDTTSTSTIESLSSTLVVRGSESAEVQITSLEGVILAGCVITSFLVGNVWQRSTTFMGISRTVIDELFSERAYAIAIASYRDGDEANNINSQWYLNQGDGQAFPGQLLTMSVAFTYDGADAGTHDIIVGRQVVPATGELRVYPFVNAGTQFVIGANGQPISYYNGTDTVYLPLTNIVDHDDIFPYGASVWQASYLSQLNG